MRYYYPTGIKGLVVYYQSKASWQCQTPECSNKSIHLQGEKIRWSENVEVRKISENESLLIDTVRVMKLHKGCTALCPSCKQKLTFLGWEVWVEDNRKEQILAVIEGFHFRTGVKIKDRRLCKTLKSRKATVNRLIKKLNCF